MTDWTIRTLIAEALRIVTRRSWLVVTAIGLPAAILGLPAILLWRWASTPERVGGSVAVAVALLVNTSMWSVILHSNIVGALTLVRSARLMPAALAPGPRALMRAFSPVAVFTVPVSAMTAFPEVFKSGSTAHWVTLLLTAVAFTRTAIWLPLVADGGLSVAHGLAASMRMTRASQFRIAFLGILLAIPFVVIGVATQGALVGWFLSTLCLHPIMVLVWAVLYLHLSGELEQS